MTFEKSPKVKRPLGTRIAFIVAFIVLLLYCSFILFFLFFGFVLGIKPSGQSITTAMSGNYLFSITKDSNFLNFINAVIKWQDYTATDVVKVNYFTSFFNSLWKSLLGTTINWFCTTLVCYILVNYRSKFTRGIYLLGLFLSMIPLYGAGAAEYRLFSSSGLNIMNTPFIYLSNITLFGANFFYMYAFWKSISWEYAEAAEIDGCSQWKIFFKIMLPMVIPSSVALFVMLFIGNWNNYEYTVLYMDKFPDLAYGIYIFDANANYSGANTHLYFASVLLSFVPIVVLFICFQNTIMEKVYLGGLKG